MSAPLIGVTACIRPIERHEFHAVAKQYVRAVIDEAGCLPLIIPALGEALEVAEIIRRIDGLLLTGSPSNVEPRHYSGPPARSGTKQDPARDATTLPLIRRAVAAGVPVLGLCRGVQELNVALGGTLHQHVHELPGKRDHRARDSDDNDVRYAPVHSVRLAPGGMLARLAGANEVEVNSLHAQAIDRLAPGFVVEARAPDGVIEAVRLAGGPDARPTPFALGVQWHPEWHIAKDRLSRAIFVAFGDAARAGARGAHGGFAA